MTTLEQKFRDILLVSDIDGTMAYDFNHFPQRNIEAVERFQVQGGRFTIATGRHFGVVKEIVEQFHITAPLILLNGGCIYDPIHKKATHTAYLPPSAVSYMRHMSQHPLLSNIRVMDAQENASVVYVRQGEDTAGFEFTKYEMDFKTLDEMENTPLYKALLITDECDSEEFRAYVQRQNYAGVDFVASSERYYEMVPKDIHKAQGIEIVTRQLGIDMKQVVAIGDYNNDLEMIKAVGFGVAPENALDAVKAAAKLVVGDCRDGAVADLIDYLDTNLSAN